MSGKSKQTFSVKDVEYETNRKEEQKSGKKKVFAKKFIFIQTDQSSDKSDSAEQSGHNLDLTKIVDRESESEFTETSVRVLQENESSSSNL